MARRPPVETFANEVVGGNSIFFGGAALRLRQTDFARWPLTYADLEPHYAAAEALLEIHGRAGIDPTEPPRSSDYPFPPPPLTAPAQRIFDAASALGLRPFQLPIAINHAGPREPRCLNCFTCDGFPCRIEAKNDVTQTALRAADPRHLTILARVEAARLLMAEGRVVGLEAIDRRGRGRGGRRLVLKARRYLLAAGAIGTPALMLRSGLQAHDASGALGRNLMRHCNGMMGYLFPFRTNPAAVNHKQIGIADFYEEVRGTDGTALGIIQDMCMPPPDVVRELGPPGFRWAAAVSADRLQTLICIAEDDPRPDNRVSLSDDRIDRGRLARHHRDPLLRRGGPSSPRSAARHRPAGAPEGGGPGRQGPPHRQLLACRGDGPVRSLPAGIGAGSELPNVGHSQSVRGGWQLHADLRGREPEPHHHRQRPAGRCAHCRTVSESHRRRC